MASGSVAKGNKVCKHGHPHIPENRYLIYTDAEGYRHTACKICRAIREKQTARFKYEREVADEARREAEVHRAVLRQQPLMCTAKQREFLHYLLERPDINQIGFGGRRGAGKTAVGCLGVTLRAIWYENTEHLCIRRVQKTADLNLGREFRKVFKRLGLPFGSKRRGQIQWYTQDKFFEFPNGSIIELGFCLKDDDWERYQGREAATVWLAEGTQFPELAFQRIGGSNRSVSNPACPGKRIVDFNPGGLGNDWVLRRFVDEKTRDRRTVFIPAGIRDSAAVLEHDPGYVLRTLRGLPDWMRRQWEEGDMRAVAGQFWQVPDAQICEMEIPRHADWYAGVDWGKAKPFAVVWMARWKDWYPVVQEGGAIKWDCVERAHLATEVYQAGLDLDEQAKLVLDTEKTLRLNGKQVMYYGDPHTGDEREHASTEAGRTVRDAWAMYNFYVNPALSNARVPGWNLMKMLLRHGIITISPRCLALLSEMRSHVAEGAPGPPISEDLQQGSFVNDHAADAARYVCLSTFGLNYSMTGRDPYADPDSYPKE